MILGRITVLILISLGSLPGQSEWLASGLVARDTMEAAMSRILPTENQDWGFWGTMREHAAEAWPIAFTCILGGTKTESDAVRAFLDSRQGRHFADGVNDRMERGASLADAITKTTAEWMAWRITPRTSYDTGLPVGLPYLTGFVARERIAADDQQLSRDGV
jgi:hypothetical protein